MLSWFFKKRGNVGAQIVAPSLQPTVQWAAELAAEHKADAKAKQAEDARALWLPQLQSAQGDDAKLLLIAQAAPLLEIKLAAVEALATEDALKQAEREFRGHDRRVHQTAKRRLEAAVAQREARARAQTLIETALALTGEALIPVNRLVALERDWQALDANFLEPIQQTQFSELRERLDASLREHAQQEQHLQRWTADATRSLAELRPSCAQAIASGSTDDIALRSKALQALTESRPDVPATAALDQALQAALQTAAQVEARLAWLAALDRPAAEAAPAQADDSHVGERTAVAPVQAQSDADLLSPARRWQALSPLEDGELARVLEQRFEQWQRKSASARPMGSAGAAARSEQVAVAEVSNGESLLRLDTALQLAESALAEGHLGVVQQHLYGIDATLEALNGVALSDTVRSRRQALQAEYARLRDWQQWGGDRAREALVDEAEELARLTLAAADRDAIDAPKLRLKAHADAIHALRKRWKELDRLGAAAGQALWQRFDAALQTAHQPVAEQQAVLRAARQENLLAREALLAVLEALPVDAISTHAEDLAAHRKEQLRALERFQAAWRQLGPLEHTVPPGARDALQERLRSSVDRIDAPLREARRVGEAAREQLVADAEALLQEHGRDPQMRDAIVRARELQAKWQQHARTLPLPRPMESALWGRFKAATDAVFAQHDAACRARDAELAADLEAREALLRRLADLPPEAPEAEIQRTLTEVERAWRQASELPRGAAASAEARFRDARARVLQRLSDSAQKRWQAQCDTLAAKLALCEERELASGADGDLVQRWAEHAALPALWEQALVERWSLPVEPGPLSESALDELLLELEAAFDLPAAPESQAARRNLKLRAMKDALEGRGSPSLDPARRAQWLAVALRQSSIAAAQRERLHALIKALRQAPKPGWA